MKQTMSESDRDYVRCRYRRQLYPDSGTTGWIERQLGIIDPGDRAPLHIGRAEFAVSYSGGQREMILKYLDQCEVIGKTVGALVKAQTMEEAYQAIETAFNLIPAIGSDGSWLARRIRYLNRYAKGGAGFIQYSAVAKAVQVVPWQTEWWWVDSAPSMLHSIRSSEEHLGQISYYPNFDKFKRNITVAIKPGRYLAKYFGKGTRAALPDTLVRRWAAAWENACKGHVLHRTEAPTLDNRDEIASQWEKIYKNGPGSCMKGNASVRIFAYPGNTLRLAYFTEDNNPGGTPVARCIVRDDKMEWLRIYPDDQGTLWQDMLNKLSIANYKHGHLDEIKLRFIRRDGEIVCPYIDEGTGGGQGVNLIGSKYLECGGDEYDATGTSGILNDDERCTCEACGDRISLDDSYNCGDVGPFCSDCYNESYCYAYDRRGQEDYPRDECIQCETSGDMYVRDDTSYRNIYQCAVTDKWYHVDYMVCVGDEYVHKDQATALDVDDSDGDGYALPGDTVSTMDGRTIRDDESVKVDWWDGKSYLLHLNDDPEDHLPAKEEDEEDSPQLELVTEERAAT